MNKFYSLIVVACLTLCGAATAQVKKSVSPHGLPLQPHENIVKSKLPRQATGVVKAEEQETWKDLGTGTFSDAILSNMYDMLTNEPVEVTIQESEQTPGRYRIVAPWSIFLDSEYNYLVIDATNPDFVVIPPQPCPVDDIDDGETWIASLSAVAIEEYDYTADEFIEDYPDLNITMRDGVIRIPAGCMCFMWPYATSGYAEPGEWVLCDETYDGYIVLPGHEYVDEWESVGTGSFFDGYVWTFILTDEPAEVPVEIKQNIYNKGFYKLVKPFAQIYPYSYDLIIDCSDPEFVKVPAQSTGIPLQTYGTMQIISMSSNNYESLEDFIESGYTEANNITLSNNVINIPAMSLLMYFPSYNPSKMYFNEDAVDSYFKFPPESGINDVIKDAAQAEDRVEYYNLQGIKIENPTQGLFIRRENGCSTKVLIK